MIRAMRQLSLDVRQGRHSGFPWCCIAFFALVWRPLYRYRGPYDAWMHRVHGPIGCGYVPCPRCMNRPIIVRDCDDRCGHVAEQWELTSMVEGAS